MITLKNEFLCAKFNTLGAELKSLEANGREYIWQADPKWWDMSSPVLFPICGRLMDNEYYFDGKRYPMNLHGFAWTSEFEVEKKNDTSVTFLLKSSEKTLEIYPFSFELRIIYTLYEKKLISRYEVTNKGDDTMYFSIGSHEGYYLPEGVDCYDIEFPQKSDLFSYNAKGNCVDITKELILKDEDTLHLKKEMFVVDTLIFKDVPSKSATLKKRDGSREIRIEYDGFENLMLWQIVGAPYLCVEVWNGMPDRVYSDKNFKTKEGICTLSPERTYSRVHSIEIVK